MDKILSIAGKAILYTGAAGGLGLNTTLELMNAGAVVVAVDYDPVKIEALDQAARKIATGSLLIVRSDMTDLDQFRSDIAYAASQIGGFDVVINNAAIYPSKPFQDYTIAEHQLVQRVNVDAAVVAVQVALPDMKAKGWGRIINVSSICFYGNLPNLSPYVASKGALIGLTRAWAREFGNFGVTANAILPGAFPTDAETIHPDPEGYTRFVLERQAVQRRGSATDIANAISFFASENAGFITGQSLNIDGGWFMN